MHPTPLRATQVPVGPGTVNFCSCVSADMSRSLWMLPIVFAAGCSSRPVVVAHAKKTLPTAVVPQILATEAMEVRDPAIHLRGSRQGSHGTLVVLNKKEDTASIIHLGTGKTYAKVATGPNPNEVAISPDGKTAIVSDMGHGAQNPGTTLTLIDLVGKKSTGKIELGEYGAAHGVLWLDSNRVLFTSHMKNALGIVDVSAKKIIKTIDTGERGTHLAVVSPDKKTAYAANAGTGSLTIADLVTGKVIKTIPCGARAEGVAISPDGTTVTVGNVGGNSVDIIDTAKLEKVKTLSDIQAPIRTAFSADGKSMIVSAAGSGELINFDPKTWEVRNKLELAKGHPDFEALQKVLPMNHALNGKSKLIYFVAVNANAVAVVDPETMSIRAKIPTGDLPDGVAWSPLELGEQKLSATPQRAAAQADLAVAQ